jgi:hypothetical protein
MHFSSQAPRISETPVGVVKSDAKNANRLIGLSSQAEPSLTAVEPR